MFFWCFCKTLTFWLREKCLYSGFFWSVFSPNAGRYGPEKLRIRTLFTQCLVSGRAASELSFSGLLDSLAHFLTQSKSSMVALEIKNQKQPHHVRLGDLSLVFMAFQGVKCSRKRRRYVRNATIKYFFQFQHF